MCSDTLRYQPWRSPRSFRYNVLAKQAEATCGTNVVPSFPSIRLRHPDTGLRGVSPERSSIAMFNQLDVFGGRLLAGLCEFANDAHCGTQVEDVLASDTRIRFGDLSSQRSPNRSIDAQFWGS